MKHSFTFLLLIAAFLLYIAGCMRYTQMEGSPVSDDILLRESLLYLKERYGNAKIDYTRKMVWSTISDDKNNNGARAVKVAIGKITPLAGRGSYSKNPGNIMRFKVKVFKIMAGTVINGDTLLDKSFNKNLINIDKSLAASLEQAIQDRTGFKIKNSVFNLD